MAHVGNDELWRIGRTEPSSLRRILDGTGNIAAIGSRVHDERLLVAESDAKVLAAIDELLCASLHLLSREASRTRLLILQIWNSIAAKSAREAVNAVIYCRATHGEDDNEPSFNGASSSEPRLASRVPTAISRHHYGLLIAPCAVGAARLHERSRHLFLFSRRSTHSM